MPFLFTNSAKTRRHVPLKSDATQAGLFRLVALEIIWLPSSIPSSYPSHCYPNIRWTNEEEKDG